MEHKEREVSIRTLNVKAADFIEAIVMLCETS